MKWNKTDRGSNSQVVLVVKNPPANARDVREAGLIPRGGHSNLRQHSCLENPTEREVWQASVHWVTESRARLKRLSTHAQVLTQVRSCTTSGAWTKTIKLSMLLLFSGSAVSDSLLPDPIDCRPPLSMGLPGKHTGVGCHFLLHGILLTQGSKWCLLH